MNPDFDVIVIGAGVSGLTAAWHLHRAGLRVALLEAAGKVGGCTRTTHRDGFLLEEGPFNVIIRDPAFEALLSDLGSEIQVVTAGAVARNRFIFRHGRLHKVPSNPIALAATGLLSPTARLRLVAGLMASRRAGADEQTIEQFAVRRFGRQVSDTMFSALIAGIFAGDVRRLSFKACFPAIARVDERATSLIGYGVRRALRARRKNVHRKRRWRGLVSIEGGLGHLMDTLAKPLGSDHRINCPVDRIHKEESGYSVEFRRNDQCETLTCRRLLLATPAPVTAKLLSAIEPAAAEAIARIPSASLAVLNLGFKREHVGHPLNGYGFLVPHNEPDFPLLGVLWADSIFPNHAPADSHLMRVFVGGARNPEMFDRTDDQLLATTQEFLRDLLQLSGPPSLVHVSRYPSAIPQYELGHVEVCKHIRTAVQKHPGLYLAGNYLEGVSLNDCIKSATRIAHEIVASTTAMDRDNIELREPNRTSESDFAANTVARASSP